MAKVCEPGTVYSCVRGSCIGQQACSSDGTVVSQCRCPVGDDDAGAPPDASSETDAQAPERDADMPATKETCDNGRDDDGDGKADCADSECSAFSCEPIAPSDFKGPIALRIAESGTPGCEAEFDTVAFEAGQDPQGAAATCSSCSCDPAAAGCSVFVDFGTGAQAGCGGETCTTPFNQSCAEITPPCLAGLSTAYLATKLPGTSVGCTPSGQTATKPAIDWGRRVVGCNPRRTQRGGCMADELCMRSDLPADPFEDTLCVWRSGDHACPSEAFTDKRLYFQDVSDTRSCSVCSCSGPNCNYQWRVFNAADTACASPIVELTSAGQCVQVNPSTNALRVGASISGDGACTAAGGASQGSVSGQNPLTVCCQP